MINLRKEEGQSKKYHAEIKEDKKQCEPNVILSNYNTE
jgi:hypothetical protein